MQPPISVRLDFEMEDTTTDNTTAYCLFISKHAWEYTPVAEVIDKQV